nr:MAG TPA: DNA-directed RNA polymerase [Caudoviricetes sp.]
MSDIRLVNVVPIVNGWNDAAKKNLDDAKTLMVSGNYPDYNAGVVKESAANLVSGLADDLMKAPAIDPESLWPVAHWEESVCSDDAFWVCSNCKFPSEAIAAPRLYHYCPNCGAKMGE